LKLCALFAAVFVRAKPEEEGGLLMLTDANFDETIAEHEVLLVVFSNSQCGHCIGLKP